jgi:hypothetical protein
MTITKLDAAERQIVAAVHLLFGEGDPVAVYTLAAAARELTTTLCEKRGVRSMIDAMEETFPEKTRTQILRWVHRHAKFFKHANNDPDAVLEDFEVDEAEAVLYLACIDFDRLRWNLPHVPEVDVFESWYAAKRGLPLPPKLASMDALTTMSRDEQLEHGRRLLDAMRAAVENDQPPSGTAC